MTEEVRVVLPHRGEFGSLIVWHAPAFHALGGLKVIYVEHGHEALYPGAQEYVRVPRREDALRRWFPGPDSEFVAECSSSARQVFSGPAFGVIELSERSKRGRFRPAPHIPQGVQPAEVVVCPRWRTYGPSKNWGGWPAVAELCEIHGLRPFCAGVREASFPLPGLPCAWDYGRPLDATIEAMLQAKAVIATDSGLAHLAVMCGAPLVLVTHGAGLVAPGPVVNEQGRVMQESYPEVKWKRYHEGNHLRSKIVPVEGGWANVEKVLEATLTLVRQPSSPASSVPAETTTQPG